jgi:small subunit ribosomal protein S9
MNDEERKDEDVQGAEDAPEQQPGDQASDEAPEQEVPEAEDKAPTAEPPAEAAQEEGATAEPADKKEKKPEAVPGAELDPIAIEPERELSAEEKARREAEEEERARREAELTSDPAEQPLAPKPAKLDGDARYLATGKRKSSVARVILTSGSGAIEVNKRKLEEYFPRAYLQSVAKQALVQSGYEANVDVRVRVRGGGISGQAAAVRHGIARALCDVDPELRRELKRRGMLTRDARVKERRKAGLKKARKKPQFSKR